MKSLIEVPKKAQHTSVLKNLPDKRQAAILEYYETHKGTDTVKWLRQHGIETSVPSLSTWRTWYLEKRIFDKNARSIMLGLLDFKLLYPHLKKKELDAMGEFVFNALAIKLKDVKTWNMAQQVQLKRERQAQQQQLVKIAARKMKLEIQKYRDQKGHASKKEEEEKTGFTPVEKERAVKQILGIS